jgi:hypothetical protein
MKNDPKLVTGATENRKLVLSRKHWNARGATMHGAAKPTFDLFYREVFLPEHRHPVNVALHMLGTFAGLAFVPVVLAMPLAWYPALLLFPLVHAAPGLLGHRLLERNITVGDARWRRRDYPRWWFIVANHRMTFERLTGRTPPG